MPAEGNQQVAANRGKPLSPSLFTFCSQIAAFCRDCYDIFMTAKVQPFVGRYFSGSLLEVRRPGVSAGAHSWGRACPLVNRFRLLVALGTFLGRMDKVWSKRKDQLGAANLQFEKISLPNGCPRVAPFDREATGRHRRSSRVRSRTLCRPRSSPQGEQKTSRVRQEGPSGSIHLKKQTTKESDPLRLLGWNQDPIFI